MKINSDQFWKLLKPIHPQAENFCRKLAGNREDGDDLYQEVLLLALNKFYSLRENNLFRPWLYRIIVNAYKNRHRQPWWSRRVDLTPEILDTKKVTDPSKTYSLRRLLYGALTVLSVEDRGMILLSDMDGWTVTDLVRIYNKPDGTIKARLSRARQKMRQAILQNMPQPKIIKMLGEGNYGLPRGKTATE